MPLTSAFHHSSGSCSAAPGSGICISISSVSLMLTQSIAFPLVEIIAGLGPDGPDHNGCHYNIP